MQQAMLSVHQCGARIISPGTFWGADGLDNELSLGDAREALGSLSAPRVAVRVVEEALPVVSCLDLRLRGRGGDAEQIIERRARVRAVAPGISPRFWAQARSRVLGNPPGLPQSPQ